MVQRTGAGVLGGGPESTGGVAGGPSGGTSAGGSVGGVVSGGFGVAGAGSVIRWSWPVALVT